MDSIALEAPNGGVEVTPFWGPFRGKETHVVQHGRETLSIEMPDKVPDLDPSRYDYFSPRVCRLVLSGRTGMRGDWVLYQGVGGEVRPPDPDEVPDRTYLAYGTSITEGGYPSRTARRLGADVRNLATSGAAQAEPELADYVASVEWDVATLSLSVNMLGFAVEEFRERAAYMVNTAAGENPDRPVVAISHFTNQAALKEGLPEDEVRPKDATFREALRAVVEESPHGNVHHVAGTDLLTDVGGLSTDTTHPSPYGHVEIAERLAPRLDALL